MEYIFILFIFSTVVVILQISYTGKLHDMEHTMRHQASMLRNNFNTEERLFKEVLDLQQRNEYLSSEVARLERMTNNG